MQALHAVISSADIIFSGQHERFMTADEVLTAQCIPVRREFSHGVECCSFAVSRTDHPSRSAKFHMSGNSMHSEIAGLHIVFALTQIQYSKAQHEFATMARNSLRRRRHTAALTQS